MKIRSAVVAVALLACSAANAEWEKEPQTVFGLKLGVEVVQLGLPACPAQTRPGYYATPPASLCVLASMYAPDKTADLYGTPDLTVPYKASLSLYNGRVSSVLLSLQQADFAKMRDVLVSRLGKPTTRDVQEVVAGSGARLASEMVTWKGKALTITAIERVGDIHSSYVSFSDNQITEARIKESAAAAQGAGSKF